MILSSVIAGVLISGLIYAFTGFTIFGGTQRKAIVVEDAANAELVMLAYNVLGYIRDDDFSALSNIVHPELGVVLSPYATIDLTTDRHYSAEQISTIDTDTIVYVWGVRNGGGEPIQMTPAEYLIEFVPAAEHMYAPVLGINQIVRSGNALENLTTVFPNVKFVDFHIPGGEPIEEFDWSSLRLGFEEYEDSLKLVVIAYSKWAG